MPLIVADPYEHALAGLETHLAHLLHPRPQAGERVRLVGPVGVYAIAEQDIARGRTKARQPLGWYGLVSDSEHEPIACVGIAHHPDDGTAYAVEGPVAARRLHDTLHAAEAFARTTRHRYRLRVLRLHRLQIDVVWLQGRHTRVIIMRDGVASRTEPRLMARSVFQRLIKDRLRARR
jgi:hypothetical protein